VLVQLTIALAASALAAEPVVPTPVPAPIEYTEVVPVEGASAAELYNRAMAWFVSSFVDSKQVLEVQNREEGLLIGKGTIGYEPPAMLASNLVRDVITFTVTVMVKDGRYKYTLADFRHSGTRSQGYGPLDFGVITTSAAAPPVPGTTKGMREKDWKAMQQIATRHAKQLVVTLREAMTKPVGGVAAW
jgi:hypothetical protein